MENKLKKSKIVISCDKWLSKILNKKTFRINLLASNLKSNDLEAAIIKRKNYYKDQFKKIKCEIIEVKLTKAIFSILKIRKIVIKELKKNFDKIFFISNINCFIFCNSIRK